MSDLYLIADRFGTVFFLTMSQEKADWWSRDDRVGKYTVYAISAAMWHERNQRR